MGEPAQFDFGPKTLGSGPELGMIDFDRGVNFAELVYLLGGMGARMERAYQHD